MSPHIPGSPDRPSELDLADELVDGRRLQGPVSGRLALLRPPLRLVRGERAAAQRRGQRGRLQDSPQLAVEQRRQLAGEAAPAAAAAAAAAQVAEGQERVRAQQRRIVRQCR